MFTCPLFLIGGYVTLSAILDYHNAKQFDDWWSTKAHIDTFLAARVQAPLNLPTTMALRRKMNPDSDAEGVVHLQLRRGLWNQWQPGTLETWNHWFDGTLIRDGSLHPVELRKRGDTSVHWITDKKSFTLKMPRSSLFKGYRRLAFSVKKVLALYLSNRLAGEFDLMAPYTTVTPVFLNRRFYGIFRVCELIDESFLRRHGRMPGNIFRGDTAERGEYFKGLPRALFGNPYIWDRVAVGGQIPVEHDTALKQFLRDLNTTTFADHLRFMGWFDRKEIAHLIAYLLAVGDLHHMSGVNNQFWYEDPSSGLLHPIPWDVYLYPLDWHREQRINRFLRAILKNPFVVEEAFQVLNQHMADNRLYHIGEQLVTNAYNRYENYFAYDHLRRDAICPPGTPDEVLPVLRNNLQLLREWINNSTFAYHAEPRPSGVILDFQTRGYVGSNLHAIDVEGQLITEQMPKVVADWNRNGVMDISDPPVPGQWTANESGWLYTFDPPLAMLAGVEGQVDGGKVIPAPLHYRIFITKPNRGSIHITAVRPELHNRLTGKQVRPIDLKADMPVGVNSAWHPWQYPTPSPVEHCLSGDIQLDHTLLVGPRDTLIIEPGTTVRLAPDVCVLVRGRLVARGEANRPINFQATESGRPWGTLALHGDGASGSLIEHTKFVGGGAALLERVQYKAMVSVHWADNITFRRCAFEDNVRSDDAVNAVHANVLLHECAFRRTNADAIDFDYSSGTIRDCTFDLCRNDAIDLMRSDPMIINNHITASGDKGISIGEASRPFVFNNYIAKCLRGVEIKDRSEPYILHNHITQNTTGIHQAVKNWRYGGGGWGKQINSLIERNGNDLHKDSRSRLTTLPTPKADLWKTILAHHGIRPASDSIEHLDGIESTSDTIGRLEQWSEIDATPPIISGTFVDDFDLTKEQWFPSGGVTRLAKRDQDLVMIIHRRQGAMWRRVDWDLTDDDFDYIIVIEVSCQNVKSAHFDVRSNKPRPPIKPTLIKVTENDSAYAYVSTALPPDHYSQIRISATPASGRARIALHSYQVYAITKASMNRHHASARQFSARIKP